MSQPPPKDWLDIAIDFFFGALFGIFSVIGVIFHSGDMAALHGTTWLVFLLSASLICGSLAALARDLFWSKYETYTVIPPIKDSVSKRRQTILWIVFALGCASPVLLFIW